MDYLQKAKRFRTKKRLGQNFLINSDVINSIPDYVNLTNEDTVLEIGPGIGFVTELLVKKAKKVIAVEIDKEAIYELKKIKTDNLTIIENDILKTDISELTDEKIKIANNLIVFEDGDSKFLKDTIKEKLCSNRKVIKYLIPFS